METTLLQPPAAEPCETWPSEVLLIISVLEQESPLFENRRSLHRHAYRVKAGLEIVNNLGSGSHRVAPIFTRDANSRGLGFVSDVPMSVADRARLHLPSPADRPRWIDCSVIRCRSFIDGWFECAVIFDHEQRMFEPNRNE